MRKVGWGKGAVSVALLSVLLMPSPRVLSAGRRAWRHHTFWTDWSADHHPVPLTTKYFPSSKCSSWQQSAQDSKGTTRAIRRLQDLDESELATYRAAADPSPDIKRNRHRAKKMKDRFWSLQDRPARIRPDDNFLAMLRLLLNQQRIRPDSALEPRANFGSGPCHSIPRPRESTIDLTLQSAGLLA